MISPHEHVASMVGSVEPALESSMRHYPFAEAVGTEGMMLRGSICGFACLTLSAWLVEQGVSNRPMIGHVSAGSPLFPDGMQRHVVIRTEHATIDPTYSQFMRLAVPKDLLSEFNYPLSRVAYIPHGSERYFGDRYAEFALGVRRRLRLMGASAIEGLVLDEGGDQQVSEALSGVWTADYESFDSEAEGEVFVRRALDDIRKAMSE